MHLGLYESLITRSLAAQLAGQDVAVASEGNIDEADQSHVLARHVQQLIEQVLSSTKDPVRRVEIVNGLIDQLSRDSDQVLSPPSQLLRLARPSQPGETQFGDGRPGTPLSDAALLTNAKASPTSAPSSAPSSTPSDEVDLLCAFVKWHGLRLLEPELRRLARPRRAAARHHHDLHGRDRASGPRPAGAGVRRRGQDPVRRRSAPACTPRPGCSAATPASTRPTSAPPTSPAPRCSTASSGTCGCPGSPRPPLLQKFHGTFDTYWNDPSFELYDPDVDRDRLDDALAEASGATTARPGDHLACPARGAAVPLPAGDARRARRRARSCTAGTATWSSRPPAPARRSSPPSTTAACAMPTAEPPVACCSSRTARRSSSSPCAPTERCSRDANFGELYVGGARPERWEHVFASVQSLHSYGVAEHPGGRLRRRGHRRVPPRRGADVPTAPRPPRPRASCSA